MARIARVVIPGVPHHVTQRGNNKRQVFFSDADYLLYLRLLRRYSEHFELSIWGYCLMPNHVHLIAVPQYPDSLARALARTHHDFAQTANIRSETTGHFWQNRFYSCPMDSTHTWRALAYVERNPVRAGLSTTAADYRWSSAKVHLGGRDPFGKTALDPWYACYDPASWQTALSALSRDQALEKRIREASRSGRPLGDDNFLTALETRLGVSLRPGRPGRPKKLGTGDAIPNFLPKKEKAAREGRPFSKAISA